jgi:hypothetical protein
MSQQSDLYTLLVNDATVSSLVGTGVYPQKRPLDADSPCIAYAEVATEGTYTMGRVALDEQGIYQLMLFSESHAILVQLAAAVRQLSGSTQGNIQKIQVADGPGGYDFELNLYTQQMEIITSIL